VRRLRTQQCRVVLAVPEVPLVGYVATGGFQMG
jgi:hypothetical protein